MRLFLVFAELFLFLVFLGRINVLFCQTLLEKFLVDEIAVSQINVAEVSASGIFVAQKIILDQADVLAFHEEILYGQVARFIIKTLGIFARTSLFRRVHTDELDLHDLSAVFDEQCVRIHHMDDFHVMEEKRKNYVSIEQVDGADHGRERQYRLQELHKVLKSRGGW